MQRMLKKEAHRARFRQPVAAHPDIFAEVTGEGIASHEPSVRAGSLLRMEPGDGRNLTGQATLRARLVQTKLGVLMR
jgi:hypothetical protein